MDAWIAGGIFLVAYALIASERLDRTLVAMLGGLLLIVLGVIDQEEAFAAIDVFAKHADGKVTVGLYKGNIHFVSLADCPASIYNEADSSMEASEGLNPVSSQGFAEIQSVEARALARAGQIRR